MRALRYLVFLILAVFPLIASGQQAACLNAGRLGTLRDQILKGAGPNEENIALRDELLKSATAITDLLRKSRLDGKDGETAKSQLTETQTASSGRLCSMLNTAGWPTRASVTADGMNAFLFLIGRTLTMRMQLELYPLVAASYEKGELEGSEILAAYVDRLRLAIGRKQLYGTQVYIKDGFLVQGPIENAASVDKRRELMKIVPLRQYERSLEIANRLPLIRSVTEPVGSFAEKQSASNSAAAGDDSLGLENEGPVIKLETAFVSIDVNVPDAADGTSVVLEKSDFKLFDNGRPVEIETFSKAETPFDIVLLLDLSGSTSEKVGLIKKTTKRFVEMKRPGDRVAVITFNDTQNIVSELEADQKILLDRIKKIGGNGASAVWKSLDFALDMLDEKSEKGRRRAIVLMTDGADNLLSFAPRLTSPTSFADLIESVQNSNATIFPVFLDTFQGLSPTFRENAYRTLDYIAEQSGGTIYAAKKLDDLSEIYHRVMKGVGTVYTLGFSPDGESTGVAWRTIKVEVPSHPTLKLRHRPGYFTR
ncbi:MAG TPA: VWA domain-containing protein [Pyrinomonadaceae bacterium]|nr:VWA domain-containing protein [Pyrinomonadaceae bacterium]